MKGMEVMRRAGQKLAPTEEDLWLKIRQLLAHLGQPPLDANTLRSLDFQAQSLVESGRLDPFRSARALRITDPAVLGRIYEVRAE